MDVNRKDTDQPQCKLQLYMLVQFVPNCGLLIFLILYSFQKCHQNVK